MRNDFLIPLLAICTVVAMTGAADAHSTEAQGAEEHGAHQHGHARLTVAAEGQQLELMLESPVANVLGFEHAPATAAEQTLWQQRQTLLVSGQWLRLPDAAKCQLQSHQLDNPWSGTAQHHADLLLTLSYHCQMPAALTQLQLELFRHAADLQHIAVQWVHGSLQGAATLTPAQPQLQFGRAQ